MTKPNYDILDGNRSQADEELGRDIIKDYGYIEAHVPEMDNWVSMPLRLVHDQAAGLSIECGPYDFDTADINRLREVIAAYDKAIGRTPTDPEGGPQ